MNLRCARATALAAGLCLPAWAEGPALTVPTADLDAAFQCIAPPRPGDRAVLLVHGTSLTAEEHWSWNYALALPALGYAVCTVQFPGYAFGDVQESSEYAVHAIRRMHAATGQRIAVLGHSQGGIEPRWAMRWWLDVREAVDDLIMLATPNHGAAFGDLSCSAAPCLPALWQQSQGSQFLATLNAGDETPGDVDYTSIYSHTDWVIQPSLPEATAALDGAANIAVQDVCPGHVADHIQAAFDAVVYALVIDALSHDGPADPARIDPLVCTQDAMPYVDRVTAWERTAALYALAGSRQSVADNKVDAEPPLRSYVQSEPLPAQAAGGGALSPLSIALLFALCRRRVSFVSSRREAPCRDAARGPSIHRASWRGTRDERTHVVLAAVLVSALAACSTSERAGDATAGAGSFERYSYTNEAGTRTYKVFVPQAYDGVRAWPLIVELHGCGGDADEEARWSRFNEAAAARGLLVAYPEQDADANGSGCWNWFRPEHQARDAGEPALIAGITRAVMAQWNVDARRVYVGGISAGGAMADVMAVTYPDLYAAAMIYAGCEYMGTSCTGALGALPAEVSGEFAYQAMGERARVVPVLVIQGDQDPLVPYPNAELVVQQFLASDDWADDGENNASIAREPATTWSGAKPDGRSYDVDEYTDSGDSGGAGGCLLAQRWLIHGTGHQWSNGQSDGSARDVLFTDPLGPDVTGVAVEFFLTHPMPEQGAGCLQTES